MNLHEFRISEATVEYGTADSFGAVGFACLSGTDLDDAGERSGTDSTLLPRRLAAAIRKFNPELPNDAVKQVVRTVQRPPHPTLIENNRWLHGLLTDGVEVEYRDATTSENRGGRARLADFDNPANNDFLVVHQMAVATTNGKQIRPDLIVYLNGLPLAVIELKDPTDESTDLGTAIDQQQEPAQREVGPVHAHRAGSVCVEHVGGCERWLADPRWLNHEWTSTLHALASSDRR